MCHHPLNWYGTSMSNLLTLLNAYKGNSSGSITADGTSISYNFTSTLKPKFVAHFHGHLHNFRTEMLGTNKVLSITIPNACSNRNNEYGTSSSYSDSIHENYGDKDSNGNQRQYNKTANTANDTALNVVVVDMQNEVVHAYCYGVGLHRSITFDGVLTETEKDVVDEPDVPDTPDEPETVINIIDTVGYTDNTRLSTSNGSTKAETGYVTTGLIDLTPYSRPVIIHTKGVDFSQSYSAVCGYTADGTSDGYKNLLSTLVTDGQIVLDSSGNVTFTIESRFTSNYIKVCGYGSGENLIVSINQEIT